MITRGSCVIMDDEPFTIAHGLDEGLCVKDDNIQPGARIGAIKASRCGTRWEPA